ncbi:translation initiation factor [Algisphaera agarilytica]|uniref:Translation initiation factor 1 n=1 Tax=Algisphaera agarilytica TaxID=1385975 RepID=A0A7X0H409_9BACT|nr:translation initiation factor [Algisphaera agarilytica]MBB6428877.1 translation initiation factor 1 [Algisphaera agarilytica]
MGLFDGTALEQPVTCEHCSEAVADCACPRDGSGAVCRPQDQPARVQREKRRGKWTTVVRGLDAQATDLPALLKQIKKTCSAGGTVTADGLEVQGDHRDRLVEMLKAKGYPAKPAGG